LAVHNQWIDIKLDNLGQIGYQLTYTEQHILYRCHISEWAPICTAEQREGAQGTDLLTRILLTEGCHSCGSIL
jgi:hypothetical protein